MPKSIENIQKREEKLAKIDEQVLEALKSGMKKKDIVKKLHIGRETLYASIDRLISKKMTSKTDIKRYADEVRDNKLLNILLSGYTKEQAGKELHMGNDEIAKSVTRLIESGRLDSSYYDYNTKAKLERQQKVLEQLLSGKTIRECAETLNISRQMVYVYERELIANGRIKREEITRDRKRKSLSQEAKKEKKTREKANDTRLLQRWQTALKSIDERTQQGEIDEKTQKLCFMYCRNIVEYGEKLQRAELELLARVTMNGKKEMNMDVARFISTEYAKIGSLQPAIEFVDGCIKTHGKNEQLVEMKQAMVKIQQKREKMKNLKDRNREECEAER